jgi:hypothetical protein
VIKRDAIVIPKRCPVLGIPIKIGGARSIHSPSLDRIKPNNGYVPGNVRVISDHANRLKGNLTQQQLERRALSGHVAHRHEYALLAAYVGREALLAQVRLKADGGGRAGLEWANIFAFLDRAFAEGACD